jgi:hypothetical protein
MHLLPYSTRESITALNKAFCPSPIHEIEKAVAALTIVPWTGTIWNRLDFPWRNCHPIIYSPLNVLTTDLIVY